MYLYRQIHQSANNHNHSRHGKIGILMECISYRRHSAEWNECSRSKRKSRRTASRHTRNAFNTCGKSRKLYYEGSNANSNHKKRFGHPSEVGYKDVLNSWNPTKFDPEYLTRLYKKAVARFLMIQGVHHDNYDLWNSQYQPGSHRDTRIAGCHESPYLCCPGRLVRAGLADLEIGRAAVS